MKVLVELMPDTQCAAVNSQWRESGVQVPQHDIAPTPGNASAVSSRASGLSAGNAVELPAMRAARRTGEKTQAQRSAMDMILW